MLAWRVKSAMGGNCITKWSQDNVATANGERTLLSAGAIISYQAHHRAGARE